MEENKGGKAATEMFDLSRLRLSQDFGASVGVKKVISTIPVRKPDRQWFVRVHEDAQFRLETAILEIKEDRETYLVEPALWPELAGEIVPKVLLTAINRQGVVFLWPVRLPGEDGRQEAWNASALEAANLATRGWVRIAANMSLGAYEVFQANANLPEPVWPEIGLEQIIRVAFKDRFIKDLEHPVLRKLRGEA